uniref:Bleomycin hydrolase n=1 Tax=Strigamia maritima TaxID=126957 RepID=T1J2L0_STRMM
MAGLSADTLQKYCTSFYSDPKNVLAQNVVTKQDPLEVCITRQSIEETCHVFTHKIEVEGKPITHQRNSGRCWIFACLNVIRIPFMKQFNLEEFEFSQAYLFFGIRFLFLERCNYLLHKVVEIARRGDEHPSGRLLSFLMNEPVADGGQWDMLVNLINKHGLMPKSYFPDAYSDEHTPRMNSVLRSKVREYTKTLWDCVESGMGELSLQEKIEEMMGEIYRIVGICLGIPAKSFTWEYYDKNKQYHSVGPVNAVEFYEKCVKPIFNVDDKICLVTDPRPSNGYGKLYTVDCLGNMMDGRQTLYNNQPVELLIKVAVESIKNNEAVWFGCDVAKYFYGSKGYLSLDCLDYKLVFGTDVCLNLDKANRLIYGESKMTHAMVFTAVSVDENGEVVKWRVENSWGDDRGDKGYIVMLKSWFHEFVYEIVVDKKYVPPEVLSVLTQDPIVLPAWDPMGALA